MGTGAWVKGRGAARWLRLFVFRAARQSPRSPVLVSFARLCAAAAVQSWAVVLDCEPLYLLMDINSPNSSTFSHRILFFDSFSARLWLSTLRNV